MNPQLIINGEELEQWGICIYHEGFLAPVYRFKPDDEWQAIDHFPPKLAAYMDIFITQHYHKLNNQYGNPKAKKV